MQSARKKLDPQPENIAAGSFTKKDAGLMIASGGRHVHSSALGDRDPSVKLTQEMITKRQSLSYPWEGGKAHTSIVHSSENRYETIKKIVMETGISKKRAIREKVEGVLEELLTNSIYHAYHKKDGSEKYSRKKTVSLDDKEKITLSYCSHNNGVYLSVMDQGGNLTFEKIMTAFARCYGVSTKRQIEMKESGAGLGMYLIFESVMHLKIVTKAGKKTQICCWIGENTVGADETFTFNFITEE